MYVCMTLMCNDPDKTGNEVRRRMNINRPEDTSKKQSWSEPGKAPQEAAFCVSAPSIFSIRYSRKKAMT